MKRSTTPSDVYSSSSFSAASPHRRRAESDSTTTSSTYTLEEKCERLKEEYFGGTIPKMLGTRCKCTDNTESDDEDAFDIMCVDRCEFCIGDNCARYKVQATITEFDFYTGDWTNSNAKECLEFDKDSFDGINFCIEDGGYTNYLDVSIDGESCYQSTLQDSGDIQIDCYNLGYSSNIVLSGRGETSANEGPFAFYDNTAYEENYTAKDGCDPSSSASSINTVLSFTLPIFLVFVSMFA